MERMINKGLRLPESQVRKLQDFANNNTDGDWSKMMRSLVSLLEEVYSDPRLGPQLKKAIRRELSKTVLGK